MERSGSHEPARVTISVLGEFVVTVDGRTITADDWPRRRAADILKLLALAPHGQLHAEQVIGALWPESSATAARQSLHNTLYHARRVLEPTFGRGATPRFLVFARDVVRLAGADEVDIDALAFERAARTALADGGEAGLVQARDRYTGDLLPQDRFLDWTAERRDELRSLYLSVLTTLAARHREAGEHDLAIAELSNAIACDPLHEPAQMELLRAYAAAGLRHQAIVQYRRFVTRLNRELGEPPSAELTRCFQELVDRAAGHEAPVARRHDRGRLPADLGRFVGRRAELAEVGALLGCERLVSLTGPGGVGKTRLAIEAAGAACLDAPDAVTWVDLGDLADGDLVAGAVVEALGGAGKGDAPPIDVATRLVGDRRTLLVLDTCEHVLDAAADVTRRLLRACAGLSVLATSRQALGIPGEALYPVRPLDVPDAEPEDEREALTSDAVQLFLERSPRLAGSADVDAARVRAIVAVCRRVDGIPLGIELAAARTRALPVEQLAERLDSWPPLLGRTGGGETQRDRQRTLRATIEWSYRLLSPGARVVLARLSTFAGSWGLDAAEAVACDDRVDAEAFFEALVELVDKSLVSVELRRDGVGPGPRYRMLDTVREFSHEQLVAAGDDDRMRTRHAAAVLRALEPVDTRSLPVGAIAAGWLLVVAEDQDNVRAALDWSLRRSGDPETGRRIAASMRWYWSERGQLTEGRGWLEAALEAGPGADGSALSAQLLVGLALLAWRSGDLHGSRRSSDRALTIAGDPWTRGYALTLRGSVIQMLGRTDEGVRDNEAALVIFREHGDAYGITWQLSILARAAIVRGQPDTATELAEEGLAVSRAANDAPGAGWALGYCGLAHAAAGRFPEAVVALTDALGVLSEHDWWGADVLAASLVRAAALAGQEALAAQVGIAALERLERSGASVELSAALRSVAVVAQVAGRLREAARLQGAARAAESSADAASLADPRGFETDAARLRAALGEAVVADEEAAGRAMGARAAAGMARELLEALRAPDPSVAG